MTQTYLSRKNSAATSCETPLLCFYTNRSRYVQVLRIDNPSRYWERAIFPGQRLLFEAQGDAKLEVYSSENCNNLLADVIPCYKLEVSEE